MTNRAELQNEYHGLINKLNSTNRKVDQKTETVFSVRKMVKNQQNCISNQTCDKSALRRLIAE